MTSKQKHQRLDALVDEISDLVVAAMVSMEEDPNRSRGYLEAVRTKREELKDLLGPIYSFASFNAHLKRGTKDDLRKLLLRDLPHATDLAHLAWSPDPTHRLRYAYKKSRFLRRRIAWMASRNKPVHPFDHEEYRDHVVNLNRTLMELGRYERFPFGHLDEALAMMRVDRPGGEAAMEHFIERLWAALEEAESHERFRIAERHETGFIQEFRVAFGRMAAGIVWAVIGVVIVAIVSMFSPEVGEFLRASLLRSTGR